MFIPLQNATRKGFSCLILALTLIFSGNLVIAQSNSLVPQNFAKFNFYGGYDWLTKTQKTNFNNNKTGGLVGGIGFDKFWNKIGLLVDLDYAQNKANKYDSVGIYRVNQVLATNAYTSNSKPLERLTLAIGPAFRQDIAKRMFIEFGILGGLSKVWNGNLDALLVNTYIYHDIGYSNKTYQPIIKGKFKINYLLGSRMAAFAQADYIYHLNSTNNVDFFNRNTSLIDKYSYEINSYRATAGLSVLLGKPKVEEKKLDLTPPVVVTPPVEKAKIEDNNVVQVQLVDEQTGFRLYNADVVLTDGNGQTYTAKTDKAGVATFDSVKKGDYEVSSMLNGVASTNQKISSGDFRNNDKAMVVELKHNDPRFTLVGFTTNKTTAKREAGVEVKLKNETNGNESISDSKEDTGEFMFQLVPKSDYTLYGKKDSYISNIEKITTKGLQRSTTLYVLLELGVEEAKINKIIKLNNIYYDLDKAEIRHDASTDLQKLLQFLKDNPSTKIEISSHTDSRGATDYNLQLSYNRAKNVTDFLINHGIEASRIVAVGYGEERLMNKCADGVNCPESEHQKNRRTEFKVIK